MSKGGVGNEVTVPAGEQTVREEFAKVTWGQIVGGPWRQASWGYWEL